MIEFLYIRQNVEHKIYILVGCEFVKMLTYQRETIKHYIHMRVSGTEVTDSRSSTYDKDKLCSCFKNSRRARTTTHEHMNVCYCIGKQGARL